MNEKSRRILGTIFGSAMGLAYSLVAQNINGVSLPGIPLYEPPPGKFGTILITILIGGLMGLIAAWPDDALPGILLSAVAGIAVTSLLNIYLTGQGTLQIAGALIVFFITFLPRAVLFLPLAALTRWAIGEWSKELQDANFSITRLALSLLLVVLVAGAAGALSLYPRQGRQVLKKTYSLIQEGKQTSSLQYLPEALKPVDGFIRTRAGHLPCASPQTRTSYPSPDPWSPTIKQNMPWWSGMTMAFALDAYSRHQAWKQSAGRIRSTPT